MEVGGRCSTGRVTLCGRRVFKVIFCNALIFVYCLQPSWVNNRPDELKNKDPPCVAEGAAQVGSRHIPRRYYSRLSSQEPSE